MNDTELSPEQVDGALRCRWCGQSFKTRRGYRHHRAAVRKYGRAHEDRRDQLTRDFDEGRLGTGLGALLKATYRPKWERLFSEPHPFLRLAR